MDCVSSANSKPVGVVMANPWFNEKCEVCGIQLRSKMDLGIASYQTQEHDNGFCEEEFKKITAYRKICNRCSGIIGYEE